MKVKVFRLESWVGHDDKVLLRAEHRICEDAPKLWDRTFFYLSQTLSNALAWTTMSWKYESWASLKLRANWTARGSVIYSRAWRSSSLTKQSKWLCYDTQDKVYSPGPGGPGGSTTEW